MKITKFAPSDDRNETIGKKIRESEISKIPYMIILGEKEAQSQSVSLRKHQKGDVGNFDLDSVVKLIKNEIKDSHVGLNV